MAHKYDLTIINCLNSYFSLFEDQVDNIFHNIWETNSYKLKKKIRDYNEKRELNSITNDGISKEWYLFELYEFSKKEFILFKTKNELPNIEIDEFELISDIFSGLHSDNDYQIEWELYKMDKFVTLTRLIRKGIKFNWELDINDEESKNLFSLFSVMEKFNAIKFNSSNIFYYQFLYLLLFDYGTFFIEEILDYQLSKIDNKKDFVKYLKKHIKLIPEPLNDTEIIDDINEWIIQQESQTSVSIKTTKNISRTKLTNLQLVYIALYNNEEVSREKNGNTIYNLFCENKTIGDRLAAPTSKTIYKNKLKLFEIVISNLENNAKNNAIEELNKYKTMYSSEFEK